MILTEFRSVRYEGSLEIIFAGWQCSGDGVMVFDTDAAKAKERWQDECNRLDRNLEEAWQHLTSRKATAPK